MGQRRDYAIFLSTILFGAAVAPGDTVAPFVSLGHLREGSHSHYCMATVVARDEEATHTGPRRLFAITTKLCSHVMQVYPNPHARFELGPAEVMQCVKGDVKKWNIDGRSFDFGDWSRVGVVMLQAEGFGEAVTLADWKSATLAEVLQRESGSNVGTAAYQTVELGAAVSVADWDDATGQLTKLEATIVSMEQCFPNLPYLGRKAELYKEHFICAHTSENMYFSGGAPLYKITDQGYNLLGILTAIQHDKKNQHLFLNVRAYTDTFEGLIEQLKKH